MTQFLTGSAVVPKSHRPFLLSVATPVLPTPQKGSPSLGQGATAEAFACKVPSLPSSLPVPLVAGSFHPVKEPCPVWPCLLASP